MEWFKHNMLQILRKNQPPAWQNFQASNGWLANFLANYEISCQTQTEKKGMSNSFRVPLLKIFHESLCRIQQTMGLNPRDLIFGRFSPLTIFNTDQIPISFIQAKRRSYNTKNSSCWVITPSGTAKRSATLILTLRAGGPQIVPPFVLFRGKGCLEPKLLADLQVFHTLSMKRLGQTKKCVWSIWYFFIKLSSRVAPKFVRLCFC